MRQKPPDSDYASPEPTSSEKTMSKYLPSSSPIESSAVQGRRVPTRSVAGCAPSDVICHEVSSDSDTDPATSMGRKRRISQIASSPLTQRSTSTSQTDTQRNEAGQSRSRDNKFCTQQCLRGLQQGGALDARCPNVRLHQPRQYSDRHPISAGKLVQMVKQQLDENLDRDCSPMGGCGSYGAPFRVTCAAYGYTVVGKGTTTRRWKEVSREAEIYRVLRRVQGSAVPVFLGTIDLAENYFLHGAGDIRHMLLMGWAGESVASIKRDESIQRAITRSERKIRALGVVHEDLQLENIMWNAELKRALIIDFHRCTLDNRPIYRRPPSLKRLLSGTEEREVKRVRVI
jgi:hypothetical protein